MNGWDDFVGKTEYGYRPPESSGGDVSFPAAVLFGILGGLLFIAALVGGFMGAIEFAGWAVLGGVVCVIVMHSCIPANPRRHR